MATIRKRGDKWQAQIRKLGSAPLSRSFTLKKDAEAWARQSEHAIDLGEAGLTSARTKERRTLDEFLVLYLRDVSSRKRSLRTERSKITMFRRQPIAQRPIVSISSADVAEFRNFRLQTVSGETVRQDLVLLGQVIEHARKECNVALKSNPCTDVQKPASSPPRTRRISEEEMEKLIKALAACRNPMIAQVTWFALATGMRRGEVLGIKWRDINLERQLCLLHVTKNGRPRTVPLSAQAVSIVNASLSRKDDDPVFPVTENAFRLAWQRVQVRSGIEDFRFHDLRHEAVSRFFERGLSLPEVALISGHRDPRQLLRYTHLDAADLVGRL